MSVGLGGLVMCLMGLAMAGDIESGDEHWRQRDAQGQLQAAILRYENAAIGKQAPQRVLERLAEATTSSPCRSTSRAKTSFGG